MIVKRSYLSIIFCTAIIFNCQYPEGEFAGGDTENKNLALKLPVSAPTYGGFETDKYLSILARILINAQKLVKYNINETLSSYERILNNNSEELEQLHSQLSALNQADRNNTIEYLRTQPIFRYFFYTIAGFASDSKQMAELTIIWLPLTFPTKS